MTLWLLQVCFVPIPEVAFVTALQIRHEPSYICGNPYCEPSAVVQESLRGLSIGRSRPEKEAQDDSAADSSHPAAAPGLQNQTGEYNCFLNVIIQCLWHCRDFRDRLLALPAAVVQGALLSPPISLL